jgi:hypothetical protein
MKLLNRQSPAISRRTRPKTRAALGKLLRAIGVFAVVGAVYAYGVVSFRMNLVPYPQVAHLFHELREYAVVRSATDAALGEAGWAPGRYVKARTVSIDEEKQALLATGYLQGTTEAGSESGVTRYHPERVWQGWNLAIDGAEAAASLLGMDGRVVHRWALPFDEAFPNAPESAEAIGARFWRKVRLLDNGSLLAIYEGQGLIKIDKDSRILWAYGEHAHHDLDVDAAGNIHVLIRDAVIEPRLDEERPVLKDQIVVLSPNGEEIRRISVLDALLESDYASFLDDAAKSGDILHTNTVELLDDRLTDRLPAFRSGSVLVSWPTFDAIGVIDLEAERVTWALSGMFVFQHDPTVLDNGHLLVFDNRGDQGQSKVIELDPVTQEVVWAYRGSENAFATKTGGANQRLPNGNTLIVETDYGRAFEVTPDREIVWEYLTPNRAGSNDELIASLLDLVRLPPDLDVFWLDEEG